MPKQKTHSPEFKGKVALEGLKLRVVIYKSGFVARSPEAGLGTGGEVGLGRRVMVRMTRDQQTLL